MKQKHIFTAVLVLLKALLLAQQVPDTAFTFSNPHPKYAPGKGSVVWLDEAHHNFHTLDGRYSTFGKVLRADGYQVQPNAQPFTPESLADCNILVIANALDSASDGSKGWRLPVYSAFTPAEIGAVKTWVQKGGRLFLIADHMPFAGAAHDLALAFGVNFLNCFALDSRPRKVERFYRGDQTLADCEISRGIDTVVTFTGSAFSLPAGAQPVLFLVDYNILLPEVAWQFKENTRYRDSKGLCQLGYLRVGKGLVVVSGEAAMFSAQLSGPNRNPVGMNHPDARQNARLLLNILHWLDQ